MYAGLTKMAGSALPASGTRPIAGGEAAPGSLPTTGGVPVNAVWMAVAAGAALVIAGLALRKRLAAVDVRQDQ
jgi:hypothetical protein